MVHWHVFRLTLRRTVDVSEADEPAGTQTEEETVTVSGNAISHWYCILIFTKVNAMIWLKSPQYHANLVVQLNLTLI